MMQATNPPDTLKSEVLSSGSGRERPAGNSVVTVRYSMRTSDGTLIDSSNARGGTATVWKLDRVMAGLRDAVQLMVVGEQRRLWIPPALGYQGRDDRPAGTLVFDVELLAIAPGLDAPASHEFAAPAPDAERTPSGLAYKVLRPGGGSERPKPMSTVTIHYTGWTTDRSAFDDSVARGEPLEVAVDTVIPGLSEALQRMGVGEKTRFWIPAELAYTPPGPPRGQLVFDVELLAIQREMSGQRGTIQVQTNSPDAPYVLVQPDGTPLDGKGPRTFTAAAPGRYRIKPDTLRSYALGLVASPADMVLAAGGMLAITITYRPIIQ